MKRIIIIALFLFGCGQNANDSASIKSTYGVKRLKDVARDFLTDIGAEEVYLENELIGYYFNPDVFELKQHTAYTKWRKLFAKPKNCKLSEIYQINFSNDNLISLFSIKKTSVSRNQAKAAVIFPSLSLPLEFDPRCILSHLSKGVHVLAIHYEKMENSEIKDLEKIAMKGTQAALWIKETLDAKIFVHGKSYGAVAAMYAALNTGGSSLILENPKITTDVYAKKCLDKITGSILLITDHSTLIPDYLPKKSKIMQVSGGYHGRYFGEGETTWYESESNQIKLTKFLQE
jgi:hypothetical protein